MEESTPTPNHQSKLVLRQTCEAIQIDPVHEHSSPQVPVTVLSDATGRLGGSCAESPGYFEGGHRGAETSLWLH